MSDAPSTVYILMKGDFPVMAFDSMQKARERIVAEIQHYLPVLESLSLEQRRALEQMCANHTWGAHDLTSMWRRTCSNPSLELSLVVLDLL